MQNKRDHANNPELVKIMDSNGSGAYRRKSALDCRWSSSSTEWTDGICHESAVGVRKGHTISGSVVKTTVCEAHANEFTELF